MRSSSLAGSFDPVHGGFGRAPKFPPATTIGLLLRCHARFGDERALEMAGHTLDAMARGGMYDQIGGGFARYSTDERWLIPHFEKMLYDNALLARAYLEGSQVTGDERLARVAREVLDYVLREMIAPEGAFFSATDADSEGEEGRFFVWTPAEVEAVWGPRPVESPAPTGGSPSEGTSRVETCPAPSGPARTLQRLSAGHRVRWRSRSRSRARSSTKLGADAWPRPSTTRCSPRGTAS